MHSELICLNAASWSEEVPGECEWGFVVLEGRLGPTAPTNWRGLEISKGRAFVHSFAVTRAEVRWSENIMISPSKVITERMLAHDQNRAHRTENTHNWHFRAVLTEHVLSEGVIAVTPTLNGTIILFYISITRSRNQFERFVTFVSRVTAGQASLGDTKKTTTRRGRFCVFAFPLIYSYALYLCLW